MTRISETWAKNAKYIFQTIKNGETCIAIYPDIHPETFSVKKIDLTVWNGEVGVASGSVYFD
jgi:hypothetical protein